MTPTMRLATLDGGYHMNILLADTFVRLHKLLATPGGVHQVSWRQTKGTGKTRKYRFTFEVEVAAERDPLDEFGRLKKEGTL